MNIEYVRSVVGAIKFQDWRFHIGEDGERLFLQVRFLAPCNVNGGKAEEQYGRKWALSQWMTKSEMVQTAFKAVMTAMEHEAREQFTYQGEAIFGPHFSVDDLVELARRGRQDVRPTTSP